MPVTFVTKEVLFLGGPADERLQNLMLVKGCRTVSLPFLHPFTAGRWVAEETPLLESPTIKLAVYEIGPEPNLHGFAYFKGVR